MNVAAPLSCEERRSELVGSFGKGLFVIRTLAEAPTGLTLTEVAEATGTTRATARRYLMTLLDLGYAEQIEKRFELTPQILHLVGTRFDAGLTWRMAEPMMQRLATDLGESCTATVRDRVEMVCVAHASASRYMTYRVGPGTRLPILPTACGRVALMQLSRDCLDDVIRAATPERLTPFTKVDAAEIHAAMDEIRDTGFAIVDQELELGLRSIAVPVTNASGRVFAALNISAEASRVELRQLAQDFLPPLRETVAALSCLNTEAR